MYNCIQFSEKYLEPLEKLNKLSANFNPCNKNFLERYNKLSYIQRYFEKKKVKLLKYNDEYVGFIWLRHIKVRLFNIEALYVIPCEKELQHYKELLTLAEINAEYTYECEKNETNFDVLSNLGFTKKEGTIEMYCDLQEKNDIQFESDITIRKFVQNKDEKLRCSIQNEIFMKEGRIPISVEDIYYDMAQPYYYDDGVFFINFKDEIIGYGQIIIDKGKAFIVNFGIKKNYRGKGYSKCLMSFLLNFLKDNNFKIVYIKVDCSNKIAYNLYTSFGFKMEKEIYVWERL
jgi:ribosomal protein S18 acetylase RimI-like enzyme